MRITALVLFWVSFAWLAYVYFGYPLFLWIVGFWRKFVPEIRDDYFPRVSILVSVRNEEKDILWKVRETLSWDYPADRLELLIASDASEDRTDEILRSINDPRMKYIRIENRVGKNEALNRLVQLSKGEVLLFSDANSHIGKGCLRSIVRNFADPRVGAVTGVEQTQDEEQALTVVSGTRATLDYESHISRLESRMGSVLVCDGSLFVIRRALFHELEPDLANDLELPLWIGSQGYALLFDSKARSIEKATRSAREEFNRRRRVCGQGVLGFWRLRHCLRGLRAWQFFSHKILRWLTVVPLVCMLVTAAALSASPVFKMLLILQFVFYGLAVIGMWLNSKGHNARAIFSMPFYFVLVSTAAIVGILQAWSGRRFTVWEVAMSSRGQENA
jgi:cellulose synthase/poly-beta-1,6-N-acetylglucosamine synthase-like glycosyltransferase